MPLPVSNSGQISDKDDHWLLGQISFTEDCIIRTGYSETEIHFGAAVKPGTVEGTIVEANDSSGMGIAVRALSYELDGTGKAGEGEKYPAKSLVPFIVTGTVGVPLATDVKQYDQVYRVTVGAGLVGKYTNASSGPGITTALPMPNAIYLRSGKAGTNAPISIDKP